MAITYRTPTVASATSATQVTVNKPTGTATGDLLRVMLSANAARTWNVPAGWAILPGTAAGTQSVCLYRIADGTEGASFTFSHTGAAANLRAGCVAAVGAHATTPIEAATFQQTTGGATSNAVPQVTVSAGTVLDSLAFRIGATGALTVPGTMSQDFQDNSVQSFAGAHEAATPGATGTRTWTWTGGSAVAACLCSLVPTGAVSGVAVATFGFTATTAGVPRTSGVAAGSFGFTGTALGKPRTFGAAAASFGFTGAASGVVVGDTPPAWSDPGSRTGPWDGLRNAYNVKGSNFARTRAARDTGDLVVLVIGDSLGVPFDGATVDDESGFPRRAMQQLATALSVPEAGHGLAPVLWASSTSYRNEYWTTTGTVSTAANFAGLLQMNAGSTATLAPPQDCEDIEVYYSGISVAFTYKIDGGSPVGVTPSGASVVEKFTVSGLTPGVPHTIQILAGAGTMYLEGAAQLDDVTGLRLFNIAFGGTRAASGTAAQNWTDDTSAAPSAYKCRKRMADLHSIDPDLVIYAGPGGNDIFNGDTVSNAIAGMAEMIGWYPSADHLMTQAYEVPGTNLTNWDAYYAAKYQLADDLDVGLVDWRARIGDFDQAEANGHIGTDGVHPNAATTRDFGDNIADILLAIPDVVSGAASASFGFTATAAGTPFARGQATGSFGFTATAAGQPRTSGQAVGSFGFTATAVGQPRTSGQAVASFGFAASAAGQPRATGVAVANFGFTATASGNPGATGVAVALFGFTATASGDVTAAPTTGVAVAAFGFTGTAAGVPRTFGVAVALFGFTATASGASAEPGQAAGSFGFTATASGRPRVRGVAVGAFGFVGLIVVQAEVTTPSERVTLIAPEFRVLRIPAEERQLIPFPEPRASLRGD